MLGGTAFAAPANVHIALYSATPSDTGGGTELTTGTAPAYARVATTNNTTNWPAGNPKSNGTAITYPQATGNWPRVYAWGGFDAATVGNLLYWGPLASNIRIGYADATANTITYPAHGLTNTTVVRVFTHPANALPAGLAQDTQYFVVGAATDTFQLSATSGGAAIDITASGFLEFGNDQSIVVSSGGTASFAIGALVVQED